MVASYQKVYHPHRQFLEPFPWLKFFHQSKLPQYTNLPELSAKMTAMFHSLTLLSPKIIHTIIAGTLEKGYRHRAAQAGNVLDVGRTEKDVRHGITGVSVWRQEKSCRFFYFSDCILLQKRYIYCRCLKKEELRTEISLSAALKGSMQCIVSLRFWQSGSSTK